MIETIRHLYWSCIHIQSFWHDNDDIQSIILNKAPSFTETDIILGFIDGDNTIYNFLILHAKYFIHTCRFKKIRLHISHFIISFK